MDWFLGVERCHESGFFNGKVLMIDNLRMRQIHVNECCMFKDWGVDKSSI